MIISLIVAIGKKRQIGLNNQMLWHVKEDFKKFKSLTMGHHLIMGRKTYESIGRPLPGRTTIVITKKQNFPVAEGVLLASSPDEALELVKKTGEDEVFIAGGGVIYSEFLEKANRLYLSQIDYDGEADTFFPEYKQYSWKKIEEEEFPALENTPAWKFSLLEKAN